MIGKEITSELVKRIYDCKAWALIANTTPDVSHHEQLSICVSIVDRIGYCSEHLFCCKRAPGATAQQLYDTIVDAFKSRGVTFDKLVAQTYDGASNMRMKTYTLFSQSDKIHSMFESVQKGGNLKILTLKQYSPCQYSPLEFS